MIWQSLHNTWHCEFIDHFYQNLYTSHFVGIYLWYVDFFVCCFQSSFIVFDTPSPRWDWVVPRGSEPSKMTRPKWVSIVTVGSGYRQRSQLVSGIVNCILIYLWLILSLMSRQNLQQKAKTSTANLIHNY